ncbi:hypothetical protein [Methylocella sp.]|uniref:hypothetical protein n=1 Tax=Methylocella sp. TaxID=1978226 RepID=UPI003782FBC4
MDGSMAFADTLDMGALDEAKIEAHNAIQWLARLARSYAGEAGRDEPPLLWDASRSAVTTPPFADGLRVELRLPELILQFTEHGAPSPHSLDLEGRSSAEVEAWILIETYHRGVDRAAFSKSLPYRIARMRDGDEIRYSAESCKSELEAIARIQQRGAQVLDAVQTALLADAVDGTRQAAPPPGLAVWPERFETGFDLPVEGASGGAKTVLRIGLSLARDSLSAPTLFIRSAGADAQRAALVERSLPLTRQTLRTRSIAQIAEALANQARDAAALATRL